MILCKMPIFIMIPIKFCAIYWPCEYKLIPLHIVIVLLFYYDIIFSMDKLSLAQYVMINWTYGDSFVNIRKGNRSVIFLKFTFQRTLGFYFLQIYVPLTIIVMSSWVSFWLVKTNQVSFLLMEGFLANQKWINPFQTFSLQFLRYLMLSFRGKKFLQGQV